jgi:Mrp family chromosome partitioning ATPase
MTTPPYLPSGVEEKRLSLSMPIAAGLRKTIEVAGKDMDSTLVFANQRTPDGLAGYRTVVANLLREGEWTPHRVFVTSPGRGEGKTCTAFNMAWALAAQGKSVLLAELNFARPRFRAVLGDLRIRYGIDSAMRGSVNPSDCVFSLGSERLNVAAVRDAMNPGERRHHLPSLRYFLDWGAENHDWLILDCPPVLSHAWNAWFREHAEPSLLVVREGRTPVTQARKATRRLGLGLKGVLLNDAGEAALPT